MMTKVDQAQLMQDKTFSFHTPEKILLSQAKLTHVSHSVH